MPVTEHPGEGSVGGEKPWPLTATIGNENAPAPARLLVNNLRACWNIEVNDKGASFAPLVGSLLDDVARSLKTIRVGQGQFRKLWIGGIRDRLTASRLPV